VRRDEGHDDMPAHVKSSLLNSHVSGGENVLFICACVCVFLYVERFAMQAFRE
jgi:hypothetical protein